MKSFMKLFCPLVALFCVVPLALAQSGSQLMRSFEHHVAGIGSHHMHLIQVTNNQRADLANCMAETKQVQEIVDQMIRIGHPWGRGHVDYSRRDLVVFSNRLQELDAALIAQTTAHEEFQKSLAELRDQAIEKNLQKLNRLQAKLNSSSLQLGRDFAAARPGPVSPQLSWDVFALRKVAGKWQAAHAGIAKELDLAM